MTLYDRDGDIQIQIWLAMAYDAVGRHADCIALYKRLEGSHPNKNLRKQAADLRYILEAPKLKISRDEMVKIPLIEKDYDRYCYLCHLRMHGFVTYFVCLILFDSRHSHL